MADLSPMTAPDQSEAVRSVGRLTPAHLHIMAHSLGLTRGGESYRNFFCADDDHDELPLIRDLCAAGLMHLSHRINHGRDGIYVVTPAGRAALSEGDKP